MKINKSIENEVLKYFNKKRFTKNLLIDFIEMLQDYNRNVRKYIVYFEYKFNEKY